MSKSSVKQAIERHYYRASRVHNKPTVNNEPSKTDQAQASETDINLIVDRFLKRGIMPTFRGEGQYLDTTEFPDLQQATNAIIESQNIFMSLPSFIRERFKNSPENFFSFLQQSGTQLEDYLSNPQNFQKAAPTTPAEVPSDPPKSNTQPTTGSPGGNDDASNVTTKPAKPK